MSILTPVQLKQLFYQHNIKPAKHLGQHFLVSPNALKKIVAAAGLSRQDIVLEIGAGIGALTKEAGRHSKKVIAAEKDGRLLPLLQKEITEDKNNITIIHSNILDLLNDKFLKQHEINKIIGTVPYYISHRLLTKLCGLNNPPDSILVLQKEVAAEIGRKNTPQTLLSILLQNRFETRLGEVIEAQAFWPQPKVRSRILILKAKEKQPSWQQHRRLERLLKIGFAHTRKLLSTNLRHSLKAKPDVLISIFRSIDISALCRPEELTLENWLELVDKLGKILETASKKR